MIKNNNMNNKEMNFMDSMNLPIKGQIPNLLFGRTLENNEKDLKAIVSRIKKNPNSKKDVLNREPIFEYFTNSNQNVKFYFDDDGDKNNNYTDITKDEFNSVCKTRNEKNIAKLQRYFAGYYLDISISSYNGFDKSYTTPKANPHYGKRKLSFHYVLNIIGTISTCHKIAKELCFDTSIYPKENKQQLFRIGWQHKYKKSIRSFKDGKGHRSPKLLSNQKDISKHLLQYINADCIEYKCEPDIIMNTIYNSDTEEQVEEIQENIKENIITSNILCSVLKQLPKNYVNDFKDWLKITFYYKQFGTYNNWCIWCKTSPNYKDDWEQKNKELWDNRPVYNGNGKQMIENLSNPCDEKRLKTLFEIMNGLTNDTLIVNDIENQFKQYFKVVNYKKDDIWVFNRDKDLWENITKDYLNTYLSRYWIPHLKTLAYEISTEIPIIADESIISKWFGKMNDKTYKKAKDLILKTINNTCMTKSKNNFIKEFFLRDSMKDEKFRQKLNIDKHILSVKGGKINLKTKEFSYRTQKDLISYELDLSYNKKCGENKEFNEFILDILTPVIDNGEGNDCYQYLQQYLGYSITGETKEEKILVLMGNGSNGKSKLIQLLQNTLKSNVDIVGSWNADLFNENTGSSNVNNASPEIAKLYGKRLGFINESKKSMVWGETFKKLVDTGSCLNARELYGSTFEFDLTCSFIMASNEFPNFPIMECFERRVDTLNLINNYCDMTNENRKNITINDKQRDTNIIDKISGTTEKKQGILNWLIDGSYNYYKDDKLKKLPKSQEERKKEYISGNDWFKHFTMTNDVKDYKEVNSVYETINLLTSCRVKKDDMISKFVENGGILSRKMIDGKKVPIIRKCKDNIQEVEKEMDTCLDTDTDSDSE